MKTKSRRKGFAREDEGEWHFNGKGLIQQRPQAEERIPCKSLYSQVTSTPKTLGQARLTHSNPIDCQLVLCKGKPKGRVHLNRLGQRAHSSQSRKHEQTQREPWLLGTSLPEGFKLAEKVVKIYALRMRIEMCQTQPIKITWYPLRHVFQTLAYLRGKFKREHVIDVNLISRHDDFAEQTAGDGLVFLKREPPQIIAQQLPKVFSIISHVFCSFLALVLRKALQEGLADPLDPLEWAHVIADLEALEEVEVNHQGKHFLLRSEIRGTCGKVFQATGVALPPTVRQIREVAPTPAH